MGDACNVAAISTPLIRRSSHTFLPTSQGGMALSVVLLFSSQIHQKRNAESHRHFHFSHSPGCQSALLCLMRIVQTQIHYNQLIHPHCSRHKAVLELVTRTAADDEKIKERNCVSLCVTQRRQRRWLPTDIFSAFNVLARARDSIFVGRCNALDKKDEWLFVYWVSYIGVWVGLCFSKMYHPFCVKGIVENYMDFLVTGRPSCT